MELKNLMHDLQPHLSGSDTWSQTQRSLLLLLAPFMPHVAEELWAHIGQHYSIHQQSWPQFDSDLAAEETITLIVQINGKVRDRIAVPADISEADATEIALSSDKVAEIIGDAQPAKVIYVPGRLVNIVN